MAFGAQARALSAHMADEAQELATFGELLRRWRNKRDLTQEQLADKAEVARRYLASLEGDEVDSPGKPIVRRLAGALGIPTSVLSKPLGWVPIEELDGSEGVDWITRMRGDPSITEDGHDLIAGMAEQLRALRASRGAEPKPPKR